MKNRTWKNRWSAWLFIILTLPVYCMAQGDATRTRVGIVEFEVKNDIGLENAGLIIPDWVASEFVRLGKYEVTERLALDVLLQEQALGQTGIVDDATAARVGKIHGVEGIVTGSVMKLGNTISITGRIIAVETGKVLKSSVVRAPSLDDLPREIEVLANQLCDISRAEFEIKRDVSKRRLSYLALGAGFTLAGSNTNGTKGPYTEPGLAATATYTSNRFSVWLQGVPIGEIRNIQFGGAVHFNQFWGLAAETGFIADDAIWSVFVYYYALGVKLQPRHELSFKVLLGGSTSGMIDLWDETDLGGDEKEEIDGFYRFMPPPTYSVEMLYRLSERTTVLAKITESSLQEYSLDYHDDYLLGGSYASRVFFIALQREFAIGF